MTHSPIPIPSGLKGMNDHRWSTPHWYDHTRDVFVHAASVLLKISWWCVYNFSTTGTCGLGLCPFSKLVCDLLPRRLFCFAKGVLLKSISITILKSTAWRTLVLLGTFPTLARGGQGQPCLSTALYTHCMSLSTQFVVLCISVHPASKRGVFVHLLITKWLPGTVLGTMWKFHTLVRGFCSTKNQPRASRTLLSCCGFFFSGPRPPDTPAGLPHACTHIVLHLLWPFSVLCFKSLCMCIHLVLVLVIFM